MNTIHLKRGQTITLTSRGARCDHMAISDIALFNRKMGAFDPRRLFITHLV